MPILGSSAYPALSGINTLVRSLVNDVAGNWATDQVLLPYAQISYRRVAKALGNIKSSVYIKDNVQLVVPAVAAVDSSVQVSVTDVTAAPNQLPSDLLVPLKLWERLNGSTDDFQEMTDLTDEGGLPPQPQGQQLIYWEWRSDGLYFIGATNDTQIRIRYQAVPADISSSASSLILRDGQNAVAYFTASLTGLSRGSPLADKMEQHGLDALDAMKDSVTHQMQNTVRRRRPYSSRNRTYPLL
jgi:hypothetical protein